MNFLTNGKITTRDVTIVIAREEIKFVLAPKEIVIKIILNEFVESVVKPPKPSKLLMVINLIIDYSH